MRQSIFINFFFYIIIHLLLSVSCGGCRLRSGCGCGSRSRSCSRSLLFLSSLFLLFSLFFRCLFFFLFFLFVIRLFLGSLFLLETLKVLNHYHDHVLTETLLPFILADFLLKLSMKIVSFVIFETPILSIMVS